MKEAFDLSEEEAGELIGLAQQAVDKSVSVYEFTDQVNANFSFDESYNFV